MKKNLKKTLSLVMAILVVMTCWVFIAPEQADAVSKTINLSALAAISNGNGSRADSSKIVICSDGEAGNTTVGNAKFSISSIPANVTKATLYVNSGNHGGTLVSGASVKIYLINPSKCQATSVGHAVNNIASVYGSSYSSSTGVSYAYNYYGVTEGQSLGTIYQSSTGSHSFDITNAVNTAKANGWSDLCLAFIMPAIYNDSNGNTWSDTHINVSGTYLTCEYDGAYGMTSASYSDNRTGYVNTNQVTDGTDFVDIYYPAEIYLDKTESLEDAGYKLYISGYYGSGDNYRTLVFSTIWGGVDGNANGVLKDTTMLNIFDNYDYVATDAVNYYSTRENYGVDGNNWVLNFYGGDFSATVNLKGTPNANYIGTTNTYTADSGSSSITPLFTIMQKKYLGNWSTSNSYYPAWLNAGNISGDMNIKVTVYDKQALNYAVTKADALYNTINNYTSYVISGNYSNFTSNRSSASTLLKTRKTNQNALDTQTNALTNAANALEFGADNSALQTAITKAQAIKNESNYTSKYTAATRQALETALNNATVNTTLDSYVPTYYINFSDSSTWNAGEKAAADQNSINALTNALNAVTMEIQKYNITFNFVNGNSTSDAYDYGTIITVPANSTKAPDATYHYSYKWPANVSTEVLGDATYEEIETATAHDWNDWTITKGATCVGEGAKQRDCKVCGYIEVGTVEPVGHKPLPAVEENRYEPSCTLDGSYQTVVYCSECGAEISRVTTPLIAAGHSEVIDEAVPVTCTTDGLTAGKHCSACGEVLVAQTVIPHEGHKEEIIPAVEGNCTTDGKTEGKSCSVCKTVLEAPQTVPAPGHDWSETYTSNGHGKDATHYQTCDVCAAKGDNEGHIWNLGEVTAEATCESEGRMLYTCTANGCGAQYVDRITALGHDYGEWINEESATCLDGGVAGHYECSACHKYFDADKNEITDLTIGALNHDLTSHAGQAATCTDGGWEAYETCSRCDYTTYKAIDALDHDYIDHATKAPTCTEKGWDAYKTCSRCDYTTYEEKPAAGHDYGEWIAEVEADCNNAGTLGHYQCSVCNKYFDADKNELKDLTIKALGHDYIDHAGKDATCLEGGWKAYETCSRCDYTTYEAIKALGHDYIDHAGKDATCLEDGWKAYETCSRCDYTTYEAIPSDGHSITTYEGKAATCTKDGWKAYEACSKCDYTTYEKIGLLGHDYIDHAGKDATCTEDGWKAYETCSRCDYTTYEAIGSLDHDYIDHEGKDATCLDDGWQAYQTCSRCDYTTYKKIDALKHNVITVGAKSPACDEIGWDAYEKCTRCDYTTYVEIPASGHSILQVGAKEATCTTVGWDAYEYCEKCDYTTKVEIPFGGHDLEYFDAQTVTCTEPGWDAYEACKLCDYTTKVEIAAPGHDYIDHEGQAPTCTDTGWEAYKTCENCDYSSYKVIAALEHSIVNVPAKQPACGEAGWDAYEMCLRCDYTTKTEIPALEHSIKQYEAQAPTCTEEGWEAYEACENCDYTTKTAVPATGHSIKQYEAQAPTCAQAGWKAYEACENCDYTTKVEIPVLEHKYVNHEGKDATCSEEGWKPYQTCENCDFTSFEAIPTLEHNLVEYPAKAPTCKEIGWEAYEECTKCDYTTYKELPMTDHEDENNDGICDDCSSNVGCTHTDIVTTVVNPTCLTHGKVTETCGDCGKLISETVIAPTGHHDRDGDGKCDECSAPTTASSSCGCICHKDSLIMRIIYSISRFFWKLFKITRTCGCGASHY